MYGPIVGIIPIAKPIAMELFKKNEQRGNYLYGPEHWEKCCSQYSPFHEKQDGFGFVYVML